MSVEYPIKETIKDPLPVGIEDTDDNRDKLNKLIKNDQVEDNTKSVKWSNEYPSNVSYPYNHVCISTPLGEAHVEWKSWKDYPVYVLSIDGEYIDSKDDLESAKAALIEHLENKCTELTDWLKNYKNKRG